MAKNNEFEKLIYHQKMAHKAWMDKVFLWKHERPSDELSELVWELLVDYGEAIENFDKCRDDIYETAYEIARIALKNHTLEEVFKIYRDYLIDSMIEYSVGKTTNEYRILLKFSNTISSAFAEANSDQLRKAIRHRRLDTLSQELKVAKQIQRHLLPKVIPEIPGFEFAGRLVPAAEIGGDYWSIKHYVDDGIVTMKLADISGHGVAAATLVAAVKFISGSFYRGAPSPSDVMRQTNRVLVKETPHDILVTMAYGWLEPATHKLTIVNAGHSPVFMCNALTKTCLDIEPTGPVLGVTETAVYEEKSFTLSKDDIVFFGSDGITEAGIGQPFGVERLKSVVMNNANLTAEQIADKVIESVIEYARSPHDDISLLVIKVTSDPPKSD